MADTDKVLYRLSSIDNSIIRTYNRLCLCFPFGNDQSEVQRITQELTAGLQRTVSHMPILAGTVFSESTTSPTSPAPNILDNENSFALLNIANRRESIGNAVSEDDPQNLGGKQGGHLVVQLSMDNIASLKPTFKHPSKNEFTDTYTELAQGGMPASAFVGNVLTPLPDMPDPAQGGNPVFAVQVTFI